MEFAIKKTEMQIFMSCNVPMEGLQEFDLNHFRRDIIASIAGLTSLEDIGRRFRYDDEGLEDCGEVAEGDDIYPVLRGTIRIFAGLSGDKERNRNKIIGEFFRICEDYGMIPNPIGIKQNWYRQSVGAYKP